MNTKVFLLFGNTSSDIVQVKSFLEEKLEIQFEERDSMYVGVYYKYKNNTVYISLESNYKEFDSDWIEPDFKQYNTLLNVSFPRKKNASEQSIDKIPNLKANLIDGCQLTLLKQTAL